MAKIYHDFFLGKSRSRFFITILFQVGFTILQVSVHYSQTNVPMLKTKT